MNAMNEAFSDGLRKLGVAPDDTLLVHSSLKALGWIDGGAIAVVEALMHYLSRGTLLMPALSYATVTAENPHFSVIDTPSCVGTIPEAYRTYPSVTRSIHPTHSVCAWGARAAEITERHGLDRTPVGENSPFRLLTACGGKILMLGCGLRPNTFMHGVEEAAGLPYVLAEQPVTFQITNREGYTEEAVHRVHDFRDIAAQRYDRAADCTTIRSGKVLDADTYLLDSKDLWDAASDVLQRDPWYFVDRAKDLRKDDTQ